MSRFLPADFDHTRPIAVIAGRDHYPVRTVEAIRQRGLPVRLVAFAEETQDDLYNSFAESDRRRIKVGQLGHMLKALQQFHAGYAIMVGQITPRRLFHGLHPDFKALQILTRLKERNAETIFGEIAKEVEKLGVRQLDARAFLDDDMARQGVLTGGKMKVEEEHLDYGIHIAREMARLDVGQGVVVRKGTVLAVEAFEGTDEMLKRAGQFKTDKCIFVKTAKPRQDFRFDVPVFGLRTLETMKTVGIEVAALEAGNTLVLDQSAVLDQAKHWGIQIIGY